MRPEVIKLQLFPFSLRDIAATWFDSLPYGSVNTWEELMEAYFSRFLSPSLPSERRGETTTFKQGRDESMYTAWEDLARCNMRPSSESSGRSSRAKGSGMIELNKLSAIEAKLDALIHWVYKRMHYDIEIGVVERGGRVNNVEGRAIEDSYAVEEANYLNEQRTYHFQPNPNLPTHYNPALRNHENFSYGGGALHGPRQEQYPK